MSTAQLRENTHCTAVNLLLNFTAEWDILCLKGADRYAEY